MLIALLIEKLSGQTFSEFCKMRLFAPLKLVTPTFGLQTVIHSAPPSMGGWDPTHRR